MSGITAKAPSIQISATPHATFLDRIAVRHAVERSTQWNVACTGHHPERMKKRIESVANTTRGRERGLAALAELR